RPSWGRWPPGGGRCPGRRAPPDPTPPPAPVGSRPHGDHDSYDFLGGGPLVSEPVRAVPAEGLGLGPSPAPGSEQAHPADAHPTEAGSVAEQALPITPLDEAVAPAIELFNARDDPPPRR